MSSVVQKYDSYETLARWHRREGRWSAYIRLEAVDGVQAKGLDGAMSGINRIELDPEDEMHLGVISVDVDDVADRTKDLGDGLDVLGGVGEIFRSELPDGVVGIGLDTNGQADLAFEFLDPAEILVLSAGEVVDGSVVDREAGLLEDVLAFCGIGHAIITNEDAGVIARNEGD